MTPHADIETALRGAQGLPGRHVVIVAHPDDEAISMGGALSLLSDVTILQLTDGSSVGDPDRPASVAKREAERRAAMEAGRWPVAVRFGGVQMRRLHVETIDLLPLVTAALRRADVVWAHCYEGGHIDHDTVAWLVQTACQSLDTPPARWEFASYHATASAKGSAFGRFWHDPAHPAITVTLAGDRLTRKFAACAAYRSQAHILRKFARPDEEAYRSAPTYDFTQPPPPPSARWDRGDRHPTTAEWRALVSA